MKKKFLTLLSVLLISVSTSITAMAIGNIDDKPLPRMFISSEKSAVTSDELKKDATSHYIKNTSGISLKVASRAKVNGKYEYRTLPNRFVKVHYGEYFIYNEVFEKNHYSPIFCDLQIFALEWKSSGYLYGVWSPDSVGNYPVAR